MSTPQQVAPPATGRTPATRRLTAITAVATLGALSFGYDTGVIAGALPLMTLAPDQGGLGLTKTTEGFVSASLLFGAAFGALIGGRLSDRHGRRKNLLMLSILFFLGALGCSFAPNLPVMIVFRLILGFAVGGASATVPTFLAELAPATRRGRLVSRNELMIVTGQLVAYVANAVIINFFHNDHAWRWMIGLAALPAALLFVGMIFMPESPRWFAKKGRYDEARAVLAQVRDGDVETEMDEIRELTEKARSMKKVTRTDLQTPWVKRIVMVGVAFGILIQMTGHNSVMYYAPTILKQTGLGTDTAITVSVGNGIISVLATVMGIYLIGKLGRRQMILIGYPGVVGSLILLGGAFLLPHSTFRSYAVLALMMIFMFFMQGFVSVVFWLAMSEIFPLRFRGFAAGIAVFAQWISNSVVSFLFPILIQTVGGPTFFIFAAINCFTWTFLYKCLPETKGLSMEEVEHELSRGNTLVTKGWQEKADLLPEDESATLAAAE